MASGGAGRNSSGSVAAVDWQQQVAALCGSEEWQSLLADLAAAPGGPTVAVLLRRAAVAAAAAVQAGSGVDSGGGGTARLAEVVQQVAWEKLHTGNWHAVPLVWRNAYAAACILAAAAGLPGRGSNDEQQAQQQAEPGGGEAAALGAALWHLDMAAIMGGALLRLRVDALIDALQRRWQALHGVAAWQPQAAAPQDQAGGDSDSEPPAKRARGAAPGGAAPAAAPVVATAAAGAAALPPGSLGPRGTPVPEAELPSLEAFWRDFMSPGRPVVVTDAMEDWPALARWADPRYLVAVAGPRTVPVEVGEHYLAEGWGQQLMTLQQFVARHILGGGGDSGDGAANAAAPGGTPPLPEQAGAAAEAEPQVQQAAVKPDEAQRDVSAAAAAALPPSSSSRGYLAQHPLFDQIPALRADVREPPYCVLGEGEVQAANGWLGPAGTVTPLHTDPHANLLCQAAGRKYVRLYAPQHTAAMYPHEEGMHTNTARVDARAPDPARFPAFAAAPFQDCVLEPGQMLFIPPGWWHYVQALSYSCSVSWWWR